MYKKILMMILSVLLYGRLYAADLQSMLDNGPVLSINRTKEDVFDSVISMTVINAPFDIVWNTIIDIDNYRNYMNRVLKSSITSKEENGRVIIAEFEIDAPFLNVEYTLKHVLNIEERTIEITQLNGNLKGSYWKWEFQPQDEKTIVFYSGKTTDFSSFLQRFEDKSKTISMGVNVAAVLETLNNIKKQSEKTFIKNP